MFFASEKNLREKLAKNRWQLATQEYLINRSIAVNFMTSQRLYLIIFNNLAGGNTFNNPLNS
jgi:hypothetical protein